MTIFSPAWKCLLWALVCCLTIGSALSAWAQSQEDSVDVPMAAIVRLVIPHGEANETAAGLFVGADQQDAYFITAYHAIAPNKSGAPVRAIQLQFRSSPQSFDAFPMANYDEDLDLGVVRVPITNMPTSMPRIVWKSPSEGLAIRIIGHPAPAGWSQWRGTIQNDQRASSADIHHFVTTKDLSLAGGYSGGPVFDPNGNFLGIHTLTGDSYGLALKSDAIVSQLVVWRVPTNNLATVDEIIDLLAHYANAVTSGNLWKVMAVRLLTPEEEKKMAESLKASKGRQFALKNCTIPEIVRDKATVVCDAVLNGNKENQSNRLTFSLQQYYNRWFIVH